MTTKARTSLFPALARAPRLLLRPLDRMAATLDSSPASTTAGGVRLRRGIAVVTLVLAIAVSIRSAAAGGVVSPFAVLMAVLAVAVYTNRGGRFLRDWLPIIVAFLAYGLVADAVPKLGVGVHYTPQIDAERLVAFGRLPTLWLQEHLYDGSTGPLEVFSLLMYLSHFLVPVTLGCLIWMLWPGRGFQDLLYGILLVSFLGDITFLLAPTAPPWLAAEHGLIQPVDPVLRQTLADVGLDHLARIKGDPDYYNVVAALPSLHAAWPVIGLFVIRKHRLPSWVLAAQAFVCAGVVFSIVYTGEHYFVDALLGALYAFAAWKLLAWMQAARGAPARIPAAAVVAPRVHGAAPAQALARPEESRAGAPAGR